MYRHQGYAVTQAWAVHFRSSDPSREMVQEAAVEQCVRDGGKKNRECHGS